MKTGIASAKQDQRNRGRTTVPRHRDSAREAKGEFRSTADTARVEDGVRPGPSPVSAVSVDLWKTDRSPVILKHEEPDPTAGPRQIHPPPHGTVFRISEIAPETGRSATWNPAQAREVFKVMGNESASTFGANQRHPFMHRTETIDEGEVYMLLDDEDLHVKAGDVVIQRGTNPAWATVPTSLSECYT